MAQAIEITLVDASVESYTAVPRDNSAKIRGAGSVAWGKHCDRFGKLGARLESRIMVRAVVSAG